MFAWKSCTMAAVLAASLSIVRAGDEPAVKDAAPGKKPLTSPQQIRPAAPDAVGCLTVTASDSDEWSPSRPGSFWLGISPSPPSPALQAQLNLAKDQGLVVEDVMPDSPALKAGLKQYDILLKGNNKPLGNVRDLLELVNRVKDGKLKLEFLRGGKHECVTVAPVKRPASDNNGREFTVQVPSGAPIGGWMLGGLSHAGEGRPLEFRIIGPGQILPGGPTTAVPGAPTHKLMMHIKTKLSDGSQVEILREGAEPAKVTVKRDKEMWLGTANDLSKLPEKIRPEVQELLRSMSDRYATLVFSEPGVAVRGPVTIGNAAIAPGIAGCPVVSADVEKRLAEMQKQIDELRQALDMLRKDKTK